MYPRRTQERNQTPQLLVYKKKTARPQTRDQTSHNNTTSLLQLAEDSGKNLVDDKLLDLVLLLVALLSMAMTMTTGMRLGTKIGRTPGEIDIDATLVFLRRILESKFATDTFNTGFDFLNVMGRMISLADNPVVQPINQSLSFFLLM